MFSCNINTIISGKWAVVIFAPYIYVLISSPPSREKIKSVCLGRMLMAENPVKWPESKSAEQKDRFALPLPLWYNKIIFSMLGNRQ